MTIDDLLDKWDLREDKNRKRLRSNRLRFEKATIKAGSRKLKYKWTVELEKPDA